VVPFTYLEPATLDEALALLARHGREARLIAGGTGLVNLMKQRLVNPGYVVSLRRLVELAQLGFNGSLRIGALCTHRTLETSPIVHSHAPLLAEAARRVATIRIRTMATIGGAVAHADPNQDLPPALIALGARVKLRSADGERQIPVDQFFTGYYETQAKPDEIVTEIEMPAAPPGSGWAYLKFLPQTADDYATVAVAAMLRLDGGRIADARVALGATASTPLRAAAVEQALRGQAATAAVIERAASAAASIVDPISDFRGSADYKRDMAVVFVRRALTQAAAVASGHGA